MTSEGYQRRDVPLMHLRFRCSNCGSNRTGWIVTGKEATAVQPWRPVQRSFSGALPPDAKE